MKKIDGGSPVLIEINPEFASYPKGLPKDIQKYVTPSILLKEGFKKMDKKHYEKTFSNVLRLRISIFGRLSKYYDWSLNEENLDRMTQDLTGVKKRLDRKAREIHEIWSQPLKGSITDQQRCHKERVKAFYVAAGAVGEAKREFVKKYKGFFDLHSEFQVKGHHPRCLHFFFDACKTKKQLHMLFRFVELFLDIFGWLRTSRSYERKISPEEIKKSIAEYYALLFTIRKIRRMYQRGVFFDELQAKFPMVRKDLLEVYTLDAQGKKGWAYKASDLAVEFASWGCSSTPDNFKQILKKEKVFAREVKERASRMPDVEQSLSGEIGLPAPPFLSLRTGAVPEDDWIALLRWGLSHCGACWEWELPFGGM